MNLTDFTINEHLRARREMTERFRDDPAFHLQVQSARNVLNLVDWAMIEEGLSEKARTKILSSVVDRLGWQDNEDG